MNKEGQVLGELNVCYIFFTEIKIKIKPSFLT